MARIYSRKPLRVGDVEFLELASGQRVLLDDLKLKTFQERLDHADLNDMFATPYPTGTPVPIDAPNGDPGRVRVTALFADVYGADAKAVAAQLVDVSILGRSIRVHQRVAPALARVASRLQSASRTLPTLSRLFERPGGSFAFRKIAATDRLSMHAFGAAIDLDTRFGAYHLWDHGRGHWRSAVPEALIRAFEAEGFIWGGRWFHYDTIHFEYRPELLDRSCW